MFEIELLNVAILDINQPWCRATNMQYQSRHTVNHQNQRSSLLVETTFPMLLMSRAHQRWHRAACAKTNVSLSVHPSCPDTRPGSLASCRAVRQRWWERFWFPEQRKPLVPGEWDSSRENTRMWVGFFKKEIVPTFYHLCSEVLLHQWVVNNSGHT